MEISERCFEETIEYSLLSDVSAISSPRVAGVREALPPYGEFVRAAIRSALPEDYDRRFASSRGMPLISYSRPSPRNGRRFKEHHGAA